MDPGELSCSVLSSLMSWLPHNICKHFSRRLFQDQHFQLGDDSEMLLYRSVTVCCISPQQNEREEKKGQCIEFFMNLNTHDSKILPYSFPVFSIKMAFLSYYDRDSK